MFLIQITFSSPFLSAVASTFHIKAILFPGKNLHNCLYNQTFANISVIHHSLGEFSVDEIFLPTRFFSEVLDCQHKTFQNWILIKSKWFCVYCHANGSRHTYSPNMITPNWSAIQVKVCNGGKFSYKSGFQFLARIHWVFEESYSLSVKIHVAAKSALGCLLSFSFHKATQWYCFKVIKFPPQLFCKDSFSSI